MTDSRDGKSQHAARPWGVYGLVLLSVALAAGWASDRLTRTRVSSLPEAQVGSVGVAAVTPSPPAREPAVKGRPRQDVSSPLPPDIVASDKDAFYAGLAAEVGGSRDEAVRWYARAHDLAGGRPDGADRAALFAVRGNLPANGDRFFIGTAGRGQDDAVAHRARLQKAEGALEKAVSTPVPPQATDPDGPLKRAIVIASWSLMCGELAADPGRGPGRLVATANDYFDLCNSALGEVEKLILEGKPPANAEPRQPEPVSADFGRRVAAIRELIRSRRDLESRLTKSDLVVMHLDAMLVRAPAARGNISESRLKEKQRFEYLQGLARNYRDTTEQFSLALAHALEDDFDSAQASHEKAKEKFAAISAGADKLRALPADDFFALDAESNTIDKPGAEYRLFGETFTSRTAGMSAYMAVRAAGGESKALDAAIEKAEAVLAASPDGPDRLLPHYALAFAYEARGVAEAATDLTSREARQRADAFRAKAVTNLDKLTALLAGKPDSGGLSRMKKEVGVRHARLSGADGYLQRGDELTLAGRPADAAAMLRDGLHRHDDPRLWKAWGYAELRAGKNPQAVTDELTRAVVRDAAPPDDPEVSLILGRAALAAAEEAGGSYDAAEKHFQAAIGKDKAVTAAAQSYLAYVLAKPNSGPGKAAAAQQLDDARRMIDLSEGYFRGEGEKVLTLPPGGSVAAVTMREAFIKNREAAGYYAAARLPERFTAVKLFSLATAEAARQPFATRNPAFGGPLLEAVKARQENAALAEAAAERRTRAGMESVARGFVALQLGSSDEAVRRFQEGLARIDARPTAENPLDEIFEPNFRADIRGYHALAVLAASKDNAAAAQEKLPPLVSTLEDAMRDPANAAGGESPVLLFALGRAHEELLVSAGLAGARAATAHRDASVAAFRRVRELLAGPGQTARYPAIKTAATEAIARFEKPSLFEAEARALRLAFRLVDAEKVLRDGISHHPDEQSLWTELTRTRADRIALEPAKAAVLAKEAIRWTDEIREPFSRAFNAGLVHEAAGAWKEAAVSFRAAESTAGTADQVTQARAVAKRIESQVRAAEE